MTWAVATAPTPRRSVNPGEFAGAATPEKPWLIGVIIQGVHLPDTGHHLRQALRIVGHPHRLQALPVSIIRPNTDRRRFRAIPTICRTASLTSGASMWVSRSWTKSSRFMERLSQPGLPPVRLPRNWFSQLTALIEEMVPCLLLRLATVLR